MTNETKLTPTPWGYMPEATPQEIVNQYWHMEEENMVRLIGDTIGYGRLMQLAESIWKQKEGTRGGEA
jgi:hypothetical protein